MIRMRLRVEGLHKGQQRNIQIKIDAEQTNDAIVFSQNGRSKSFKCFSPFVFGKIIDVAQTWICQHLIQKGEGQL